MNKLIAGKASILVLTAAFAVASFLLIKSNLSQVSASVGSGAIWTTNGSCGSPQNVNHYPAGSHVFINGSGFSATTNYSWDVSDPGNSGTTYHSGVVLTNGSGAFCFDSGTYPSGGPLSGKSWGRQRGQFFN